MSKIYILQKDLPHAKAGDEFTLTDNNRIQKLLVEDNPEWFKLKESENKITFVDLRENVTMFHMGMCLHTIRNDRLAEILIAESKGELEIRNTEIDKVIRNLAESSRLKQFTEEDIVEGLKFKAGTISEREVEHVSNSTVFIKNGGSFFKGNFVDNINDGTFKLVQ